MKLIIVSVKSRSLEIIIFLLFQVSMWKFQSLGGGGMSFFNDFVYF